MNFRPASTLTAFALVAVTATMTGCSGGSGADSGVAQSTPVAQAEDTSPLAPGGYRVTLSGALSGTLEPRSAAECDTDGGYDVTLFGTVNGVETQIEIPNLNYEQPGVVALRGSAITANVAQSSVQKNWRNQSYDSGEGNVTYDPDGRTGSFDLTLPEISYTTAAILPGQPPLTIKGRWSCEPSESPSS